MSDKRKQSYTKHIEPSKKMTTKHPVIEHTPYWEWEIAEIKPHPALYTKLK